MTCRQLGHPTANRLPPLLITPKCCFLMNHPTGLPQHGCKSMQIPSMFHWIIIDVYKLYNITILASLFCIYIYMYAIVHLPNNHRFNKYLVLNSDPFKETTREATRIGVAGVAHEPGAQDHLAFLRKRVQKLGSHLSSKRNHSFCFCFYVFFFTIATICNHNLFCARTVATVVLETHLPIQ